MVVSRCKNAKLYIIGDGVFYNRLVSITSDLGLEKSIIFTGYLKNPHELIVDCDVFVFTSIFEGLGNALLEAMACEKPVISTDCDAGPREIIAPGSDVMKKTKEIEYSEYGVLVPIFDFGNLNSSDEITREEKILAEAMIEFCQDGSLIEKYSKKSIYRIGFFSKERITERWRKLIYDVIEGQQH